MFGGTYEKNDNDKAFEPIPKDRYACFIEDVKLMETKTGKDYLNVVAVIADGEFAKRKLWCKLWFTEKAYNMTAQQLDNLMVLQAVGEHDTIGGFKNATADVVFKLLNKKIEVSVTGHDEYNGKTYEKSFITGFLDIPNGAFQTVPAQSAAAPAGVDASEPLPF